MQNRASTAAPDFAVVPQVGVRARPLQRSKPMDNVRPRVLVVDDREETLSRALGSALARCEVECAHDASDVIYRLDCAPGFDLIFCDLSRGDIPGPELWAYLSLTRKEAANRMVFVASGPLRDETKAFLAEVPNTCVGLETEPDGDDGLPTRRMRRVVSREIHAEFSRDR